jgi:autotransporter passenger strand-loop-strand repeat protein
MSGTQSNTEFVGSGPGNSGTDSGTTIVAGGNQFVGFDSGTGTAADTTINNGGTQQLGDDFGTGTATSTTIDSGGRQYVGEDNGTGTATGTTINSGGLQNVGDNGGTGTATSTTISGGKQYVGGFNEGGGTGTAISTTILSGGTQFVGDPGGAGTATDTTISAGGSQILDNGGTGTAAATSTTILSGGVQEVGDSAQGSGTATSTTIDIGGVQNVGVNFGTGTATDTILSGGDQNVGYGGDGAGADGNGLAISTTILSGGDQTVTTTPGDGTATAIDTTISGGRQVPSGSGGTSFLGSEQDVGFGGSGSGTATSTTIDSGGIQRVGVTFGNGTATDTTINSGGRQYVGFGDQSTAQGTATSTTISGGGIQYVGEGSGTGTAASTTILSGGVQYVGGNLDGIGEGFGTATSTLLSGGTQYVEAGGSASATTIYAGGLEEVLNGGVANSPVIDGGTLRLDGGATIGTGPVDFAAASGTSGGALDLTGEGTGSAFTSGFTTAISGFTGDGGTAALSDIIDVTGSGNAGDHVKWTQTGTSGTLQVEGASNNVLESLTLDGSFGQQRFVLTEEAGSVDQITYNNSAPCYRRGTLIEAARGQKTVEALNIGDKVRTASGALRPIKWIGRRSYAGRFVMGRKDILPVCIKSGALADNVPARDLWVSPNHAMYLNGVLIEAKDLINGVSIVQAQTVDTIDYVHIELDSHDVIIAEGALAESFIDDDSRAMFHNTHDYDTLYAEKSPAPAHYCAPRLDEGYEVEAVRQRLAQRAGLLRAADAPQLGVLRGHIDRIRTGSIAGWAQNAGAPEAPVCLDILADGKFIGRVLANMYRDDLKAAGLGTGHHGFAFTPPAGLDFTPATIEVRRSLDGAHLEGSCAAPQMRKVASA